MLSEDWHLEMIKKLDRPETFSSKFSIKENTKLLVTGFATVSQIANHCQLACWIIKFCYTWVNKCDVSRLRRKYQWSVEILVSSSAIPYLKILYRHMGPPTTSGLRALHHLNPALLSYLPCKFGSYFEGTLQLSELAIIVENRVTWFDSFEPKCTSAFLSLNFLAVLLDLFGFCCCKKYNWSNES